MTMPQFVKIVEVGPRDGLQNEKQTIAPEVKIEFINLLSASGLQVIEAGSFVSPKWVPQMADTDKVFAGIDKKPGISYPVLVPNQQGLDAALQAGAKEIAVFLAASESFSKKNINATIEESFQRIEPVVKQALDKGVKVRGYVSCVLGCPYEGDIKPEAVLNVAKKLYDMGCYEISLGDTIGVGHPQTMRFLLEKIIPSIPAPAVAVHCHDTYGRALSNIGAALDFGVAVVDCSTGGIGGCPYAPGASGNVATGAVIAMLHQRGIETGVDAKQIEKAAHFIAAALDKIPT